jgi:hypothetical protein
VCTIYIISTISISTIVINETTIMAQNRTRAPDLIKVDLTDDDELAQVIRLKARAVVPKNRRERIILALKHYTDRNKLTNKYVKVAPKIDEFGDETNLDTSELSPQDIRERIADAVLEKLKSKSKRKSSPPKATEGGRIKDHKKVSPSPSKKAKTRHPHHFPNAKKRILKDTEVKM